MRSKPPLSACSSALQVRTSPQSTQLVCGCCSCAVIALTQYIGVCSLRMARRIASSAIGAKPPHDGLPIEPRCAWRIVSLVAQRHTPLRYSEAKQVRHTLFCCSACVRASLSSAAGTQARFSLGSRPAGTLLSCMPPSPSPPVAFNIRYVVAGCSKHQCQLPLPSPPFFPRTFHLSTSALPRL